MRVKLLRCLLYVFTVLSSSFAQSVWKWRNPLPQGNNLCSVVYGNNQFIAVGNNGTMLTSPDGVTWTERYPWERYLWKEKKDLESVTYGNNQFITVGEDGTVLTSPDGVTWTERFITENALFSVAYANNKFVVVGNTIYSKRSPIFISPDGVRWEKTGIAEWKKWEHIYGDKKNGLYSVTYGNNQFIAVGSYGKIFTSVYGHFWVERSSGTTKHLKSVVYGNNQYIAVGEDGTILSLKVDNPTGIKIDNIDSKTALPLSITKVSNRLFIQMPNTKHVGTDLHISLFNASGRIVYTTKMKMRTRKFNFPISGLSQLSGGIYHAKITDGKSFEYDGSVAIVP